MPTRKRPSTTSRGKSREARLQREIEAALAKPPRSKFATVIVYSRPSGYWYALARDATTGRQITDASGYSREGALQELRGKFPMIGVAVESITDEDPYVQAKKPHALRLRVGYYVSRMNAPYHGHESGDIIGPLTNYDAAKRFAQEHVQDQPLGIYRVHSGGARRDLQATIYPR